MARTSRAELLPFIELNKKEKTQGFKIPWEERYALICAHFPNADRLDWNLAFADVEVLGRLIYDILWQDQKEEWDGIGVRPVFSQRRARQRLNQYLGNDYSYVPFTEAFNTLAGTRSLRHLASKLEVSSHYIWNLKHGVSHPDLYTIERIAKVFKKDPSYFLEYRISYILGALGKQMDIAPEITVDIYRQINRGKSK